ncbi:MAG: TIM barrel protein, partial [Spirochaetaceae bacterium]|nr:TIM barrel protein [Spirochaetaceae bacterium]
MTASLFSEVLAALPLEEAIAATARLGYPAIELLCATPHFDIERAPRDAEAVARHIRDAGLAVSVLSLHNSFTEPPRVAEQLAIVRAFIALAPAFGTGILQLDPGRPAAPDAAPEQWQCLARALPELAAMADDAGVRLAFHTTECVSTREPAIAPHAASAGAAR